LLRLRRNPEADVPRVRIRRSARSGAGLHVARQRLVDVAHKRQGILTPKTSGLHFDEFEQIANHFFRGDEAVAIQIVFVELVEIGAALSPFMEIDLTVPIQVEVMEPGGSQIGRLATAGLRLEWRMRMVRFRKPPRLIAMMR
jgi:hypothetical protein